MTESTTTAHATGRVNIAFTPAAESAARRLQEHFSFANLVDVARLGVAYALRQKMPLARPDDFGSASGSNFNIGSVDPQGELRDLFRALHPEIDEDPYRVIETLMSVGAVALDEQVTGGDVHSLRDLITAPVKG